MRSTGLFAGIHLAGNGLLLWLGYYWLGLGESRAGALLWSLLVAALLVCLTCWLYGASFAYFAERRVWPAFRTALRRLAPLVAAALALVVVYWLLGWLRDVMDGPGFRLASWLTLKLRKPVRPETVQGIFHAVFWAVRWIVVPALALPVVSAIASRGATRRRTWRYWIEAPVLLLIALWAPLELVDWVPHMKSFSGEMTSFVMRAVVAYVLFVAGWLTLAYVTARKPAVGAQ
jgi:hypothetical protein